VIGICHGILCSRNSPKWGDAGTLLIRGSGFRETRNSPLFLQRTGPFVPSLSVNLGRLVVAPRSLEEFKARWGDLLVEKPLILKKAARSNWDGTLEEGEEIPWENEPESIIFDGPHSDELAVRMGKLTALEPVSAIRVLSFDMDYKKDPPIMSYRGGIPKASLGELIYPGGFGVYCDDSFKDWICENPSYNLWFQFRPMIRLAAK